MAAITHYLKQQIGLMSRQYSKNLQRNKFTTYIFISLLIAIYRMIFMWRISISEFYADEKDWSYLAKSSTFFRNAITPDAGYFVPLTRSIFWSVDRFSSAPELTVHVLGCLIAGLCCSSSLIFPHINLSLKKKTIISLCLGCYQSFDLLLWMNINYYLFIVCFFFLFSQLNEHESKKNKFGKLLISLLFLSLGKPQLSLSSIFLISATLYIAGFKFSSIVKCKFQLILIFILISSILFSRFNADHLNLNIELKNMSYAFFGLLKIPFVLVAPIFAIGSEKIAPILNNSPFNFICTLYTIIFSLVIYRALLKKRKIYQEYLLYFLSGVLPLYLSLFFFNNTGWATEFFWNNSCIACMSSRHLFPVYVLTAVVLQLFAKSKYIYLLLVQVLVLNTIYLLTNQLF
jgi:hypothetical protein